MSPVRFRLLLGALREDGRSLLPVEDAVRSGGEGKGIAITFDDGYRHLAETLPQLMEEFKFTPTVFVPTGYIGRDNSWDYSHAFRKDPHLDRQQIRALASLGVRFGSHGHSHVDLARCDNNRLKDELERSRSILQDITGRPVTSISYPFGRVDLRVIETAGAAGYEHGFTTRFPAVPDISLARGRYGVWCLDTAGSVRRKLGEGWPRRMEAAKARVIGGLSGGTGLWNRLRGGQYADMGG